MGAKILNCSFFEYYYILSKFCDTSFLFIYLNMLVYLSHFFVFWNFCLNFHVDLNSCL